MTGKSLAFRDCMIARFGNPTGTGSNSIPPRSIADATINAYRRYWRRSLLNPGEEREAEQELFEALRAHLDRPDLVEMEPLERVLSQVLQAEGLYALQGRTGPLRELMVWRRQEAQQRQVVLPEGPFLAQVVLLDDFMSLGWADYATCGMRGAGGWATAETLYAVVPRYENIEGEEFRVTFLGHETQHFVDLNRFEGLLPWELEYRAKLVELSQVNDTRSRVLAKFTEDRGDDPTSPHSYANARVLEAVRRRLGLESVAELVTIETAALHAAATMILREDTEARMSQRASRP